MKPFSRALCLQWLAAFLFSMATPASAGSITAASAVVGAPSTIGAFTFANTIDQSGLTIGYVSGVTDFATYVGLGPRHIASNSPANYAASLTMPPNAIVDYDLGSTQQILQLGFWQYPFAQSGPILDFRVFTSNDPGFGVSTNVGTFRALIDGTGLGAPGTGVQVFDLLDTNARYLRMDVLTIDGGGFGWSEVAFDTQPAQATAVPEPASLLLLGSGLIGAGARRWRAPRKTV